MTFRQFAFRNIIRNKRIYMAHFLSSSFSVMIFFTYALILFHPSIQGQVTSTSYTISMRATMAMEVSQYINFIFSFFSCMYSVSAFLKTRKREFGILMVQGMSPGQLNKLVFMENIMIGLASIVVGILTGLIFSKLILLMSASILFIKKGLPFYLPLKAIGVTAAAFAVLFLLVALFTSRTVKAGKLIELIRSDDKPKPEPKASVWLSLLAVIFIAAGYGCVFYFALKQDTFISLLACVVLTVAGTYLLFTQLSVYVIRWLRKKRPLLLRKTNVLVLSELGYRMKDNATMFFMVSVVTSVAFTSIGITLALANPGVSQMENPYSFTYHSNEKNKLEAQHVKIIEDELSKAGFAYKSAKVTPIYDDGYAVINLSLYNQLAEMLGHQAETLTDPNQVILTPPTVTHQKKFKQGDSIPSFIMLDVGGKKAEFKVQKAVTTMVNPYYFGPTVVVSDAVFEQAKEVGQSTVYIYFVVPDWQNTIEVARKIWDILDKEGESQGQYYQLEALVSNWLHFKQMNGTMFMISIMIGFVFFTFAASFLYFRLYTDIDRDRRQYRMIAKVGLSRKEMGKVVTKQLVLMFFLPFLVAVIHGSVAFTALQQLVDFSVLNGSLLVFISFGVVQVLYFAIVRGRYLQQLTRTVHAEG